MFVFLSFEIVTLEHSKNDNMKIKRGNSFYNEAKPVIMDFIQKDPIEIINNGKGSLLNKKKMYLFIFFFTIYRTN
jgi:hypothetical protein